MFSQATRQPRPRLFGLFHKTSKFLRDKEFLDTLFPSIIFIPRFAEGGLVFS